MRASVWAFSRSASSCTPFGGAAARGASPTVESWTATRRARQPFSRAFGLASEGLSPYYGPMKATPLVCALLLGLGACRPGQCLEFRGCGLPVAQLSPDEQAAVYETAAGGAFQLSDPTLSLLIDNRLLPRGPGYGSGPTMSDDVRRTLRNRGVLKGNCQPTGETK